MAHIVKCAICGLSFDRDKVPAVKHGARRYSHPECEASQEVQENKETSDYSLLKDYINEIFDKKVNWPLVAKQIKDYKENYGYTYSGMRGTLKFAVEVQRQDTSKFKGVGIIPIAYLPAKEYYSKIKKAQDANRDEIIEFETIVLKVEAPKIKRRADKAFSFLDEEDDE